MASLKPGNMALITQLMKDETALFSTLKIGDLVEGKVIEKSPKELLVDMGRFGTGVVYRGELQNARELVRGLKAGDPVHAKVIDIDNEEGYIELSLSEADKQRAWAEAQELKEKEEVIALKMTGFNKGGLMADVRGIVGFLPVSQLSNEHYPKVGIDEKGKILQALQLLVGQELQVKIIDVNSRTNKLIISEKAAQELSAKELAENYHVGQIIEGVISGVADFGAFVRFTDNPVVEGFIHVSEIDYKIIDNPKEVLKIDEVVKAQIVDIKNGRISLSLKALKENPWEKATQFFKEGDEVRGTVYAFMSVGALVSLDHDLQGQVYVTDFGGIPEMKKELTIGESKMFTVESMKPEEKRITLKLKKD